jgi:hypothetical protein
MLLEVRDPEVRHREARDARLGTGAEACGTFIADLST